VDGAVEVEPRAYLGITAHKRFSETINTDVTVFLDGEIDASQRRDVLSLTKTASDAFTARLRDGATAPRKLAQWKFHNYRVLARVLSELRVAMALAQ